MFIVSLSMTRISPEDIDKTVIPNIPQKTIEEVKQHKVYMRTYTERNNTIKYKQYRQQYCKEYAHQYYKENAERLNEYYIQRKDKYREYKKLYYIQNKEKYQERNKQWRLNHSKSL